MKVKIQPKGNSTGPITNVTSGFTGTFKRAYCTTKPERSPAGYVSECEDGYHYNKKSISTLKASEKQQQYRQRWSDQDASYRTIALSYRDQLALCGAKWMKGRDTKAVSPANYYAHIYLSDLEWQCQKGVPPYCFDDFRDARYRDRDPTPWPEGYDPPEWYVVTGSWTAAQKFLTKSSWSEGQIFMTRPHTLSQVACKCGLHIAPDTTEYTKAVIELASYRGDSIGIVLFWGDGEGIKLEHLVSGAAPIVIDLHYCPITDKIHDLAFMTNEFGDMKVAYDGRYVMAGSISHLFNFERLWLLADVNANISLYDLWVLGTKFTGAE